jgi:hypothetical protein
MSSTVTALPSSNAVAVKVGNGLPIRTEGNSAGSLPKRVIKKAANAKNKTSGIIHNIRRIFI